MVGRLTGTVVNSVASKRRVTGATAMFEVIRTEPLMGLVPVNNGGTV